MAGLRGCVRGRGRHCAVRNQESRKTEFNILIDSPDPLSFATGNQLPSDVDAVTGAVVGGTSADIDRAMLNDESVGTGGTVAGIDHIVLGSACIPAGVFTCAGATGRVDIRFSAPVPTLPSYQWTKRLFLSMRVELALNDSTGLIINHPKNH